MDKKQIYIEIETDRPEVDDLLRSFEDTCMEYGIKYKLTSDNWFYQSKYGNNDE